MKDEELYDKIDRYLAGKLEDSQSFDSEIANDIDLQQAVAIEKTLRDAVIDHSILQTREELESIRNEVAKEKKQQNLWKWSGFILLASSFIGSYLYFQNENRTKTKSNVSTTTSLPKEKEQNFTTANTIENKFTNLSSKNIVGIKRKQNKAINSIENELVTEKAPENSVTENHVETNNPSTTNELKKTDSKNDTKEMTNTLEMPQTISKPLNPEKMTYNNAVKTSENHIFEPTSETWRIPIAENKSGVFIVIDKAGEIVYKKAFDMNEEAHWDGNSSKGVLLKAGLYGYLLDYMDGSVEQGTITLSY